MRRQRLLTALVFSLLVHGLIALWVWQTPRPVRLSRVAPPEAPLQVEIVQLPPRSKPAPEPKPAPPEPIAKAPTPAPPALKAPERPEQPVAEAPPPSGESDATTPSADDAPVAAAPGPLELLPRDSVLGIPSEEGAPTGRTIRPDDPELSEWAQRAEEEFRVQGRLNTWTEDTGAELRAQRGLPHPYFTEARDAMRAGLDSADGGTPAALGAPNAVQHMFNQYRSAAEQYARTGNPGVLKPGLSPHQVEKQSEVFGKETHLTVCDDDGSCSSQRMIPWAQLMTQSAQTLQELAHAKAMLSVTLELRQDPSGAVRSQKLVQGSSNSKFDAFVLRVVPTALAEIGPVPADALRGREELRSVWLIEGWPRLPKELERAMTMFGAPSVQGIPADVILLQEAQQQQFRFRAKLLRAY